MLTVLKEEENGLTLKQIMGQLKSFVKKETLNGIEYYDKNDVKRVLKKNENFTSYNCRWGLENVFKFKDEYAQLISQEENNRKHCIKEIAISFSVGEEKIFLINKLNNSEIHKLLTRIQKIQQNNFFPKFNKFDFEYLFSIFCNEKSYNILLKRSISLSFYIPSDKLKVDDWIRILSFDDVDYAIFLERLKFINNNFNPNLSNNLIREAVFELLYLEDDYYKKFLEKTKNLIKHIDSVDKWLRLRNCKSATILKIEKNIKRKDFLNTSKNIHNTEEWIKVLLMDDEKYEKFLMKQKKITSIKNYKPPIKHHWLEYESVKKLYENDAIALCVLFANNYGRAVSEKNLDISILCGAKYLLENAIENLLTKFVVKKTTYIDKNGIIESVVFGDYETPPKKFSYMYLDNNDVFYILKQNGYNINDEGFWVSKKY